MYSVSTNLMRTEGDNNIRSQVVFIDCNITDDCSGKEKRLTQDFN